MSGYDIRIFCEWCNAFLGWWRYAGPFQGSMRCDECRDEPKEDRNEKEGKG